MAAEDGAELELIEELRRRKTYLSTREVMDLLQVTRNTLCDWIRTGHIAAIRTGNGYRFDPYALSAWLAERTTAGRSKRGAA